MKLDKKNLLEVNKVYAKENPSQYIQKTNLRKINKLIEDKKNFFFQKLKLPPRIFRDTELLELGCGSGQNSIFFDRYGSKCTLVEYDKQSCLNTKNLFKKFAKNKFKIINKDLFKFKSKKKFDFVVSDGVAHHTYNPKKNINLAIKFLNRGGFFILGIGETNGFFQRHLQRYILCNLSTEKTDMIKFSKILFKENIKRGTKFGGRTTNQFIFDEYINPKMESLSFQEIKNIFRYNKLSLYSMDENDLDLEKIYGLGHEQFQLIKTKKINYKNSNYQINSLLNFSLTKGPHKGIIKNLKEIREITKFQNILTNKINNVSIWNYKKNNFDKILKSYYSKIKKIKKIDIIDKKNQLKFISEVIKIIKILKIKCQKTKLNLLKKTISSNSMLFRKFNGKGKNYFIGLKN